MTTIAGKCVTPILERTKGGGKNEWLGSVCHRAGVRKQAGLRLGNSFESLQRVIQGLN